MKRLNVNSFFPLLTLVVLILAFSTQIFRIPPLGKFLDPFTGVVRNGKDLWPDNAATSIDGLGVRQPVSIFFDDRKVPHIYAGNSDDLFFAQGYVAAGLRLWQMDFMSYASAGRLSEIFKEGFLDFDRNQRRTGMLASAMKALVLIEKDSTTLAALTAYTRGVNAFIRQLHYKQLPLEYKLLDYAPEPWTNLKTVLIMKYMANTLSGYEEDLALSNMMLALGEDDFNKLYPDFTPPYTPMMDASAGKPNPALTHIKKPGYLTYGFLSSGAVVPPSDYNPRLGSNSWVVSGKMTRSGAPILCNDPHLNLSLPSIWMEMQLSCPGMNVYGVGIPGTPSVMIGFNRDIAWGITNGADDVRDWYKLKISADYRRYQMDGIWMDMDTTVEVIKRRGQAPFYDTVYKTVHGPVVFDKSFGGRHPELKGYALRWELHNPSNEFLTFIRLAGAHNYAEYRDAIRNYSCPLLNFTFACRDNTIAADHQGKLAFKQPGEGKFVLDGTTSGSLYSRYIPGDSLPHVLNPSCQYVLSANQHPTTVSYPYYYNGYYSETRANRIKQLLDEGGMLDIPKMESMQTDDINPFAVDAMPVLAAALQTGRLDAGERQAFGRLETWKGAYDLKNEDARLFDLWWTAVKDYTWDEFKQLPFYTKAPDDYLLLGLIRTSPDDKYFDVDTTAQKENAGDIVTAAFRTAVLRYNAQKSKGSVRWGDINKVNITHMTGVAPFGRLGLSSAGTPSAINAMSSNWGPSWRMIVELADTPRAYGIYAGGQSGNIGSRHYDDFIGDWNTGKYYPLLYFSDSTHARQHASGIWRLEK